MADPLIAFLIKLPLALVVFLLVAYAGSVSKRVAGVLLTFPILNGIAMHRRRDDPVTVADAIYPLVIFNCVLFAVARFRLPHCCRLSMRCRDWSSTSRARDRVGGRCGSPARI